MTQITNWTNLKICPMSGHLRNTVLAPVPPKFPCTMAYTFSIFNTRVSLGTVTWRTIEAGIRSSKIVSQTFFFLFFYFFLFFFIFLFLTTVHYLQYNTYNTYLQFEILTLLTILYSTLYIHIHLHLHICAT